LTPIDPARHAVIQASAGTGKTYQLVELVKLLVLEGQATLDKILLVTYTEKATGELKARLRKGLEECLLTRPECQATLQAALDAFDQAPVHTIHSFCQRVLQEYAFENGEDFRGQLVHDQDLLQICLRELERKTWRAEYGDELAAILQLSDYSQGKVGGSKWETLATHVAVAFRPGCGHRLMPEPLPHLAASLKALETELRTEREELRRLAGPLAETSLTDHPWYVAFGELPYQNMCQPRRDRVLLPLLRWLADPEADERPVQAFRQLLKHCKNASSWDEHGFELLGAGLKPQSQAGVAALCPGLRDLVALVEQRRKQLMVPGTDKQLTVQTVQQLQRELDSYKRERGQQSFEDMLVRVDHALQDNNPRSGLLLSALRTRYQFAIVDEFQDTDPIQWRIFRRIFVEGAESQRLFVVGDPKQAIFGFRGADVEAYQQAGADLQDRWAAQICELTTNWRSCPELLHALNTLFEAGGWFEGTGIDYHRVNPPSERGQAVRIMRDATARAALTLVDLSEAENLTLARRRMARFIAGEVRGLLAPGALAYERQGQPLALSARDICILVAKRAEAEPLLVELQKAGIPYSFYKQTGLWQSAEATHLSYLLHALARPGDGQAFRKALLTRFYRIRPEDLARSDDLPAHHPVRELFTRWCALADQRRWAALFQSLQEDTGLHFHDLEVADAERRRANLGYILQTLEQAAYTGDLNLLAIVDLLDEKRRRLSAEDSDFQPLETEDDKVRLMTIHASKGLEFPVVFLAGGFTRGLPPEYYTYREPESRRLVFDLRLNNEQAKEQHAREHDHELRRLYYVALTRAMLKLYVPQLPAGTGSGKCGPLVTILAPALDRSSLASLGNPFVAQTKASVPPSPSASAIEPEPRLARAHSLPLPKKLFPEPDSDLKRRRIRIRSFSSLHRQEVRRAVDSLLYLERPPREDDDVSEEADGQEELRGPAFGQMLHDILEVIDFALVGQAAEPGQLGSEVAALIERTRRRHWADLPARQRNDPAQEVACDQQLAKLVWHALHTPLKQAGGPLWQIPSNDRLQEVEFHFPQDGPPPVEMRLEEGFLTGFMDLVFLSRGKYFLVDWKTNQLPGYSPEEVRTSMEDCGYIRQYRLYVQALARWLNRLHGNRFDFLRDFGGVYYLYVRGLNGRDESAGVFFHFPTAEDLRLERVLAV
jgi:exodeoxyribonuclease V beta subunit